MLSSPPSRLARASSPKARASTDPTTAARPASATTRTRSPPTPDSPANSRGPRSSVMAYTQTTRFAAGAVRRSEPGRDRSAGPRPDIVFTAIALLLGPAPWPLRAHAQQDGKTGLLELTGTRPTSLTDLRPVRFTVLVTGRKTSPRRTSHRRPAPLAGHRARLPPCRVCRSPPGAGRRNRHRSWIRNLMTFTCWPRVPIPRLRYSAARLACHASLRHRSAGPPRSPGRALFGDRARIVRHAAGAGGGRRPHTWMTVMRGALGRPGSSTW